jgi:hypothetical protein
MGYLYRRHYVGTRMKRDEIKYVAHAVSIGEFQAYKVDFDTRIDDADKGYYAHKLCRVLLGNPLPNIIEVTWPSNHNVIIVYCEVSDG